MTAKGNISAASEFLQDDLQKITECTNDLLKLIKKDDNYVKIDFDNVDEYKKFITKNIIPLIISLNRNQIIAKIIKSYAILVPTIKNKNIELGITEFNKRLSKGQNVYFLDEIAKDVLLTINYKLQNDMYHKLDVVKNEPLGQNLLQPLQINFSLPMESKYDPKNSKGLLIFTKYLCITCFLFVLIFT